MASASLLFFFNDTATTEIYTLSLHDALPICGTSRGVPVFEHQAPDAVDNRLRPAAVVAPEHGAGQAPGDRLAARIGPPVAVVVHVQDDALPLGHRDRVEPDASGAPVPDLPREPLEGDPAVLL